MIVCVCNAISETDLREAALEAGGDAEEVYWRLGCVPQCGMCLGEAEKVLAEAREALKQPAGA